MSRNFKNMKKLIEKKYYATADEAYEILDAFLMSKRLTADEYTDLCLLVEEYYPTEEPEVEEEEVIDEGVSEPTEE